MNVDDIGDTCTWDTAATEATSCCVTSDATATTTESSIITASVDDEKTDYHHHQQQQQDENIVADFTDDSSHLISGTESEDQSTDAETKHSSLYQFPTNVVTMSRPTAKLPAGIRLAFDSLLQFLKGVFFEG